MLYFAYGSNMDWEQMRNRCPSARFVGVARLPKHWLVFPRKSRRRTCGVASIERAEGYDVWGVVFQVDELEVGKLDKCEGYNPSLEANQNAYVRREIRVEGDGDDSRPITAYTYIANPEPNPPRPNAEYKRTILNAARFWHLPSEYQQLLETIEVAG